MSVLVLAEHNNAQIHKVTLRAIGAARKIDHDVHVLVAGSNCDGAAKIATQIHGITKIIKVDAPELAHPLPEKIAPVLVELAEGYSHILAAATARGKNIMPRAVALLDVQQVSDITAIIDEDTFERPIYAGNAIASVKSSDKIKIITVRSTAFDPVKATGGQAEIESFAAAKTDGPVVTFCGQELNQSGRPDLSSAEIVVGGGRAVGSAEGFAKIEALADKLGAAVGTTRAAVDAGYAPNDYQIGQTGKVIAPKLYIAIGISGVIQHTAGITGSQIIVAINNDADAPIFSMADYGLVADLNGVIPELERKL